MRCLTSSRWWSGVSRSSLSKSSPRRCLPPPWVDAASSALRMRPRVPGFSWHHWPWRPTPCRPLCGPPSRIGPVPIGRFPPPCSILCRSARAAAEAATGNEAARHLRGAANDLATLIVPIANAAFVLVATVLGDLAGSSTGGLSNWTRYATRWLTGGVLFVAFWIPVAVADELVQYYAAWGGLLFVLPLLCAVHCGRDPVRLRPPGPRGPPLTPRDGGAGFDLERFHAGDRALFRELGPRDVPAYAAGDPWLCPG